MVLIKNGYFIYNIINWLLYINIYSFFIVILFNFIVFIVKDMCFLVVIMIENINKIIGKNGWLVLIKLLYWYILYLV